MPIIMKSPGHVFATSLTGRVVVFGLAWLIFVLPAQDSFALQTRKDDSALRVNLSSPDYAKSSRKGSYSASGTFQSFSDQTQQRPMHSSRRFRDQNVVGVNYSLSDRQAQTQRRVANASAAQLTSPRDATTSSNRNANPYAQGSELVPSQISHSPSNQRSNQSSSRRPRMPEQVVADRRNSAGFSKGGGQQTPPPRNSISAAKPQEFASSVNYPLRDSAPEQLSTRSSSRRPGAVKQVNLSDGSLSGSTNLPSSNREQNVHFADNRVASATGPMTPPRPIAKSGTRMIQSNLGKIDFVDAGQYLSKSPKFDDPNKYLARRKPKKNNNSRQASLAERRNPPTTNRKSPPARKVSTTRWARQRPQAPVQAQSDVKRRVSQVEATDDAFMNPIADVRMPISAVPFGNIRRYDRKLLEDDNTYSEPTTAGDYFNYAQLTHNEFVPSSKSWLAPNFAHRPLYFEETQLERYGNRRPFQLVHSGLHFFGTLPILPYKMGADSPFECHYTYGSYRPGDCVPYDIYRRPLDKKGVLSQALLTTALVIPH